MKPKTRPVRDKEVRGRIKAMAGARIVLSQNKSIGEAAKEADSKLASISCRQITERSTR